MMIYQKKRSLFWPIYNLIVVLLVVGAALLLGMLWIRVDSYQKDYEQQRIQQTGTWQEPQQVMEKFVETLDTQALAEEYLKNHPDSADAPEDVKEAMDLQFSENMTVVRSREYTEESPVFLMQNDGETILEARLEKVSGMWEVTHTDVRVQGSKKGSIKVFSGCKVYCNNKELDSTFLVNTESSFEPAEYADRITNPMLTETWEVGDMISVPEMTYTVPEGTEAREEDGVVLCVAAEGPEGLRERAETLLTYLVDYKLLGHWRTDEHAANAAALCREDSPAVKMIMDQLQTLRTADGYDVYRVEPAEETEYILWGDNAVTVSFDYHIPTRMSGREGEIDGTFRVVFMDLGNGWEIISYSE